MMEEREGRFGLLWAKKDGYFSASRFSRLAASLVAWTRTALHNDHSQGLPCPLLDQTAQGPSLMVEFECE